MTQLAAKSAGYADVVYLDAKTDTLLEEVSSCNIFTVQGRTIRTPPLQVRRLSWRAPPVRAPYWRSTRLLGSPEITYPPQLVRCLRLPRAPPLVECALQHDAAYLMHMCRAQGTILPGVTRKSIIQLARELGYEVQEADVPVAEAMQADEIFTTGTAVVVSAVGSLTYKVLRRRCWFCMRVHACVP